MEKISIAESIPVLHVEKVEQSDLNQGLKHEWIRNEAECYLLYNTA
jgi:hypothetical protein